MLTDAGVLRCEELLKLDNLFDPANITAQHHVLQSLKAHQVFKRDVDYIVQDDQVVIVDEFTGRLMAGRRYSDGLHQALEAKEHVTVAAENQTLASITFQNYFRLYDKLSGPDLPQPQGKIRRHCGGHRRAAPEGTARAGGHHLH